ncbi:MAG TPA: hypothetical protein VJ792_04280 [Candidatus Nitrosotalea sp.]|nr:hypothetical protein [Candidatus Nitrosotalea sp.]
MKNQDFIKTQTEKVLSEMKFFAANNITSSVVIGLDRKLNNTDTRDFNQYKVSILEMIKEKTEDELRQILAESRKGLCPDCNANLEVFDIKCQKDFALFVYCEYILRSIIDEEKLQTGPDLPAEPEVGQVG